MLAALLAVLAAWPVSTASAAPTIGTSPGVSSYTERSAAYTTYVDPNLIISSTRPIVSATVIITEPFEMTVDENASQGVERLEQTVPVKYDDTHVHAARHGHGCGVSGGAAHNNVLKPVVDAAY